MIKEKPCKGQDEAIEFKGCGVMIPVEYRKFGLGRNCCYKKWLNDTEAGQLYMDRAMRIAKKTVEQTKVKAVKEEKVKTKKQKNEFKDWGAELQEKINLITRLIDKDLLCLARGYGGQMHAGHVYARGGNQTMRYHLHNIHRQCAQSNHFQNDDGLLREGVVREYGQEYMDYIAGLRAIPSLNYSNWEYHEFYKKASKIVLKLKKLDANYTLKERVKLRSDINVEMGIYPEEWCNFQ